MLKIHKLYSKKNQPDEGFTLLEVLIAMLIATFFVIGSMQALVLATALRVKAQERQKANQLIQEDIEVIRYEAEELAQNNTLCDATTYIGGYAENLWNNLPPVPGDKPLLNTQGKMYRLTREPAEDDTGAITSTAKVLRINFSVQEWDGSALVGNVIAEDYIEVIPDVAIETCPSY